MTQLPPSQSIDDDYTFRLLGVLTAAGRETAEGWSEIGLLINFDPNTYELRTLATLCGAASTMIPGLLMHCKTS